MKLDAIQLDPANARIHSVRNLAVIRTSLLAFGQRKNIVVDRDHVAVAGNGTVTAMRQLTEEGHTLGECELCPGASHGQVDFTDVWVEVFPGTADQARAYAIADNRAGELADWAEAVLAEQHATLAAVDAALAESTGFTLPEMDDVRAAVAAAERNASKLGPQEFPGQVKQTGLTDLRQMYDGKGTRAMVFEYPNNVYAWAIAKLTEIREGSDLPSNAAAVLAALAHVSGESPPAPEWPAGEQPAEPEPAQESA